VETPRSRRIADVIQEIESPSILERLEHLVRTVAFLEESATDKEHCDTDDIRLAGRNAIRACGQLQDQLADLAFRAIEVR